MPRGNSQYQDPEAVRRQLLEARREWTHAIKKRVDEVIPNQISVSYTAREVEQKLNIELQKNGLAPVPPKTVEGWLRGIDAPENAAVHDALMEALGMKKIAPDLRGQVRNDALKRLPIEKLFSKFQQTQHIPARVEAAPVDKSKPYTPPTRPGRIPTVTFDEPEAIKERLPRLNTTHESYKVLASMPERRHEVERWFKETTNPNEYLECYLALHPERIPTTYAQSFHYYLTVGIWRQQALDAMKEQVFSRPNDPEAFAGFEDRVVASTFVLHHNPNMIDYTVSGEKSLPQKYYEVLLDRLLMPESTYRKKYKGHARVDDVPLLNTKMAHLDAVRGMLRLGGNDLAQDLNVLIHSSHSAWGRTQTLYRRLKAGEHVDKETKKLFDNAAAEWLEKMQAEHPELSIYKKTTFARLPTHVEKAASSMEFNNTREFVDRPRSAWDLPLIRPHDQKSLAAFKDELDRQPIDTRVGLIIDALCLSRTALHERNPISSGLLTGLREGSRFPDEVAVRILREHLALSSDEVKLLEDYILIHIARYPRMKPYTRQGGGTRVAGPASHIPGLEPSILDDIKTNGIPRTGDALPPPTNGERTAITGPSPGEPQPKPGEHVKPAETPARTGPPPLPPRRPPIGRP